MKLLNTFKKITIISSLLMAPLAIADETTKLNDPNSPLSLTTKYAEKTFKEIKEKKAEIQKNPDVLKIIVRDNLIEAVNIQYTGGVILGTFYKSGTPEVLKKYYEALKEYIIYNYAQLLTLYKGQDVKILAEKLTPNGMFASVGVSILDTKPINLEFKWRKQRNTGEWQVYDISTEGISIVSTKAAEWNPILKTSGIEGLTDVIHEDAKKDISLK